MGRGAEGGKGWTGGDRGWMLIPGGDVLGGE